MQFCAHAVRMRNNWEFPNHVYTLSMEENSKPPTKKQKLEDTVYNQSEPLQSESSTLEKDEESQSAVAGCYLMEKDVGITEYMSPQRPGFFAILKQRWMLKANPS